jgi:hypothetical protein
MSAEAGPPAKLNIYVLARQNGANMRERYQQAHNGAAGAAVAMERFCQRVEHDGHASINAKSRRLLSMLRTGYYPNPYDEARERANQEGGDSEEYLRQQQTTYYHKRVAFDRAFEDGETFRYASLNIGGPGLSYYGPYCLVVRDPTDGEPAALLPANSLALFVRDDGAGPQIDEPALRQEIAPWPNRHHLTACKHAHSVASTPDSEWPTMMCHATGEAESFVEVILGSRITPQTLTEIRVEASGRLDDLVARSVTDALTDAERVELTVRLEVMEALKQHQLDGLYREV